MLKTKSGFTLVELLIVIVIIAILAAITIVAYNGIQTRARDSKRKQDVAEIAKLLQLYDVDHGPLYTGSGCGSGGNGNGFFNYPYSGQTSIMDCLKNASLTASTIQDKVLSCSNGDLSCETYMKSTCVTGGQKVTYIYANLETGTHNGTELNGTCASSYATGYGMNYFVKIVDS